MPELSGLAVVAACGCLRGELDRRCVAPFAGQGSCDGHGQRAPSSSASVDAPRCPLATQAAVPGAMRYRRRRSSLHRGSGEDVQAPRPGVRSTVVARPVALNRSTRCSNSAQPRVASERRRSDSLRYRSGPSSRQRPAVPACTSRQMRLGSRGPRSAVLQPADGTSSRRTSTPGYTPKEGTEC